MKRELKRESSKRKLLEAAKALIREKGCTHLTLQDIADRTEMSKGGIFHYVKSKDELMGWVLRESLEETDRRFQKATERERKTFEGPMREIAAGLPNLENPDDPANRVFMYLLGKCDIPEVREQLKRFYGQSLQFSKRWIAAGQEAGVIPRSVDTDKSAELFVLIALALRVRSFLGAGDCAFDSGDFAAFMERLLQPSNP